MRIAHFVEGFLFAVGFLVLCLVVLTSRAQPVPAKVVAREPMRKLVR
jgi:hypothetical protein